jgi:hypothetical protein
MEQGIVQNIKLQYRKLLLRRRVAALDREEEPPFFDFNVLDALKTLKLAWESVTPTTIVNCFSKAGFVKSSSVESVYGEPLKLGCGMEMELKMEEEEEEIQNYCNELQKQSHEYNSIDDDLELEDFINIDQDLHTSGNFRKEDIVASIMGGNNGISEEEEDTSSNSEEDDDDENYAILDEPEVLISRRVAQKALDDLRLFMRQSNCSEADLHLNTLDDLFVKLRISKQRESVQTKITDSISLNDSTKSR